MMVSNWIEEGITARLAQSSSVVVFETSDNKRFEELTKFLQNLVSDNKTGKLSAKDAYIFIEGDKLYRVKADTITPVTIKKTGLMGDSEEPVTTLSDAIKLLEDKLMSKPPTDKVFNVIFTVFLKNDKDSEFVKKSRFLTTTIIPKFVLNGKTYYNLYLSKSAIFIVTDNARKVFDDETLRYVKVVKVPTSLPEEREELIKKILLELGYQKIRKSLLNELVTLTAGLTLHETESAVIEAFYRGKGKIDVNTVKKIKSEIIQKSGLIEIYDDNEYGFEQIGGYDKLKEFIKLNIIKVLKNEDLAKKLGLRMPRGILLFGPPGTGKTLFAKAIAKETNLPFIRLKMEEIFTKWYGETESRLTKAIELIESMSPAIVFIDEIDRLGARDGVHEVTRRAFSILLEWLGDKNRKAIIIGTTNRPEDLDEAFIRVGRFDYTVPVLYPDVKAREQILHVHTKVVRNVPLDSDVNLKEIAVETEYYTGAELEELVLRAIRNAFREDREIVTREDFYRALDSFIIDRSARQEQVRRYYELAKRFANDKELLDILPTLSITT